MKLLLAFLHFLGDGFVSSLAISHQASVTDIPASCITFLDNGLVAVKNVCLGHVDIVCDDADSEDKSAQELWDRATQSLELMENPNRPCEHVIQDGKFYNDVQCIEDLDNIQNLISEHSQALLTNSLVSNNETNGGGRSLERVKARSLTGSGQYKCELPCDDNMVLGDGNGQACNGDIDCNALTVAFLIGKVMVCVENAWFENLFDDDCYESQFGSSILAQTCEAMIVGELASVIDSTFSCDVKCGIAAAPVDDVFGHWDIYMKDKWTIHCNDCLASRRLGLEDFEEPSEFRKLRPTTNPSIGRRS